MTKQVGPTPMSQIGDIDEEIARVFTHNVEHLEEPFRFMDTLRWVITNFHAVVRDHGAQLVFDWESASSPPPNEATMAYMIHAAKNQSNFFDKTLPKFLGEEDEADEEESTRDKKLVETLRNTLRQVRESSERVKQKQAE